MPIMGLSGVEPLTSRLSGVRSNHLSYSVQSVPQSVPELSVSDRLLVLTDPVLKLSLEIGCEDGFDGPTSHRGAIARINDRVDQPFPDLLADCGVEPRHLCEHGVDLLALGRVGGVASTAVRRSRATKRTFRFKLTDLRAGSSKGPDDRAPLPYHPKGRNADG